MPTHIINSRAPTRICDNGGWTDTWFARYGSVLNIAIAPYAEVQIVAQADNAARLTINAENLGERYAFERGQYPQRQPLLEATIALMGVPDGLSLDIDVFSHAPAGASTGTSAAVTVALVGGLARLNQRTVSAHEAAMLAHRIESEMLQRQSGIQDQLSAAYGGINYIQMHAYPDATVAPLPISDELRWELDRRLSLVYLGSAHDSSSMHEQVIERLAEAGPDCPPLNALRLAAAQARDALVARDLPAFGRALVANTEAQACLHPDLVSPEARHIMQIAQAHHALGWKLNGAGGPGGSLAILGSGRADEQRA